QAGHAQERAQRTKREEPQAGDRDRSVGSAQEGRAGAEEAQVQPIAYWAGAARNRVAFCWHVPPALHQQLSNVLLRDRALAMPRPRSTVMKVRPLASRVPSSTTS